MIKEFFQNFALLSKEEQIKVGQYYILSALSLFLFLGGFILLFSVNWKVCLGTLLVLWANNITWLKGSIKLP